MTKGQAIDQVKENLLKKDIQVDSKDVSKVIAMVCLTDGGNRGSAQI